MESQERSQPTQPTQHRRLPLVLPADVYQALARQAEAADRDPSQQARHIIREVVAPQLTETQRE